MFYVIYIPLKKTLINKFKNEKSFSKAFNRESAETKTSIENRPKKRVALEVSYRRLVKTEKRVTENCSQIL